MNALETRDLGIQFGGIRALDRVSIAVPVGKIFGLIGPNGAGKTTLFNLITGVYKPTDGQIAVFGKDQQFAAPHEICEAGVARTFQNIRLFKKLSVLENILVALDHHPDHASQSIGWNELFPMAKTLQSQKKKVAQANALLERCGVAHRAESRAEDLPYGDQRRVEIARALGTGARLLLLDEPAAGLNPGETQELIQLIRRLRDELKITPVLIEHDMKLVMNLCEHLVVLDHGIKIADGSPDAVRKDPKVIEAYLGSGSKGRNTHG